MKLCSLMSDFDLCWCLLMSLTFDVHRTSIISSGIYEMKNTETVVHHPSSNGLNRAWSLSGTGKCLINSTLPWPSQPPPRLTNPPDSTSRSRRLTNHYQIAWCWLLSIDVSSVILWWKCIHKEKSGDQPFWDWFFWLLGLWRVTDWINTT